MKKLLATLLFLICLSAATAYATVLPPDNYDIEFYDATGIYATPAVQLSQNLTVRDFREDEGGKGVSTLRYNSKTIPVIQSYNGEAEIYYDNGSKTGWVYTDYLVINPSWYYCDQAVPVYAYGDKNAPRVGYVAKGTKMPIIQELNDWYVVSLRAAAGFIRKTSSSSSSYTPTITAAPYYPPVTAVPNNSAIQPYMLTNLVKAELYYGGRVISTTTPGTLITLSSLLTSTQDMGGKMAKCPFNAVLVLTLSTGRNVVLELATDSCCTYRMDGRDYSYARNLWSAQNGLTNQVLFDLFNVKLP